MIKIFLIIFYSLGIGVSVQSQFINILMVITYFIKPNKQFYQTCLLTGYVIITFGLVVARVVQEIPKGRRVLEGYFLGFGMLFFLILGKLHVLEKLILNEIRAISCVM